MSIQDEMTRRLTAAMKSKDQPVVDTLRMVRAEIQKRTNAPGFEGGVTDELVLDVIASYCKSLRKSLPDYEKSASGQDMVAKLNFEIDYLSEFLPRMLDEAATRQVVLDTIAEMGVTDPKRSGQVMGAIMKSNKGRVDPAVVRHIVDEALSAGQAG